MKPNSVLDELPVAHRLKNQLAIILGFCELIERTLALDDPRRHDLEQIDCSARIALTLITAPPPAPGDHHDCI